MHAVNFVSGVCNYSGGEKKFFCTPRAFTMHYCTALRIQNQLLKKSPSVPR